MGKRRKNIILWLGITASAALMAALSIWKYQTFQMNGIDLAYFNQVFWNTIHGRPFGLTIHPHLSLGDHAEFFILALAPLYALRPRPETLLILQSAALALSGWPVYRIASRLLSPSSAKAEGHVGDAVRAVRGNARSPSTIREGAPSVVPATRGSEFTNKEPARRSASPFPLILGLAFAFSPFLQNAALYEFHILIFALPLLLFAADAYLARSFPRFLIFLVLALTVREDVALVTAAFGIVALFDRRNWKWTALPVGISAAWFFGAMKIISVFAVGGAYKFTVYYSWILDGVTTQELAAHLLTLPTLEFLLGVLMPFLFLPTIRPKWLLLSALPAAQQMLTATGAGAVVFQMHYVVLILPGLILATTAAVAGWRAPTVPRPVLGILLAIATAYSVATLGPLPAAARMFRQGEPDPRLVAAKRAVISSIPEEASVLASYDFLPALSSRQQLYSLHYAYPGKSQFSLVDYVFPDPDEIVINQEDFLVFALNFPTMSWTRDHYASGDDRLRALLSRGYGLVEARGPILRFQKNAPDAFPLIKTGLVTFEPIGQKVIMASAGLMFADGKITSCRGNDLCLALTYLRDDYQPETVEPFLDITFDDGSEPRRELLPLGFGFYPPSAWPNKKTVTLTVPLIIPANTRPVSVQIRLVRPEGVFSLSDVRSGQPVITNLVPLGPVISLGIGSRR